MEIRKLVCDNCGEEKDLNANNLGLVIDHWQTLLIQTKVPGFRETKHACGHDCAIALLERIPF